MQASTTLSKEDMLVQSVEDLERILPNMPADEQAKLRQVISEYGPGLNKYLQNAVDLSSFGSLDGAEDAMLPQDDGLDDATPYAQAAALLTQFTERIYHKETQGEPVDAKEYKALWEVVRDFSKMKVDDTIGPPMQMLVLLFQFAKNLSGRPRTQAIRLVGDLLYRYQVMRLDPFNEVDYLLALSKTRGMATALSIWESRRSKKDVENSVWWQEVGACLYLDAHNLARAEQLAAESQSKFDGYVSPKVVVQLIARHLNAGQPERAWTWYQYLIAQVRMNGGPGEPDVINGDMDPDQATELFNRKVFPTQEQLARVLTLFLNSFQTVSTVHALQDLKELNITLPADRALEFLKVIARNINRLGADTLQLLLPAELRQEGTPVATSYTPDLLRVALEKLTDVSLELRDSPNFYVAWILALANMGDIDAALGVVNTMLARGVAPSNIMFHTVIKALLIKNKLELALAVLEFMETGGASHPKVFAPKSKPGTLKTDLASSEYTKPNVRIPAPTAIHYALFLQYGARRKRHQFVATFLTRMSARGVRHDQASILALLYYRYRAGDFPGVFAVLDMAIRSGIQFSRDDYMAVWTMLADFYRTHGRNRALVAETAAVVDLHRDVLLRMVRSASVHPDLELYGAAAGTLLRAGRIAEALAFVRYTTEFCGLELNALYGLKLMRIAKKVAPFYGNVANNPDGADSTGDILMQNAQRERAMERLLDVLARDTTGSGAQLKEVKLDARALVDAVLVALGVNAADYVDRVEELLVEYTNARLQ